MEVCDDFTVLRDGELIKFDKSNFNNPLSIDNLLNVLKDILNKNELDFKKFENIKNFIPGLKN